MKKIKVLLAEPRHHTIGCHSAYIPVGVGYIAAYMLKMIKSQNPEVEVELKISIHPDEILDLIDDWKPDILASANYVWASNLSYRICEYAKEKNDNTLCIMGGPEFPTGSGTGLPTEAIRKKCLEYLKQRPCIDYYTYGDGEPALVNIFQHYIDYDFSTKSMRKKNLEIPGSMNLDFSEEQLLVGKDIPRLGLHNKIDGMDCIPSPYLTGLLDPYLNGKYIPTFQTARGCPFACTFCEQGLDENKIVSFSTQRMCEELDYVSEKVTQHSGYKSIFIFDSNWGMYKKDLVLSDHLLKLINERNWPASIALSTPKNKKQQILDIDKKLKNRVRLALSQQSMNQETLKLIKRDNMTNNQYITFVKELEQRGKNPICELIVPLPNETKQTYYDNVRLLIDFGVNPGTYTLMMLQGTELGREEMIKKYHMKSRYRIVPRDFGTYRGKKIFDIERVCVETNTMPYKDFLECRKFSLLIEFFSLSTFFLFRKLCKELNVPFFDFIWSIFQKLEKQENDVPSNFLKTYNEFASECENELFESKEKIYEFYSKDENYKKLLDASLGDNLLRKYSAKIISVALHQVLDFSINLISEMAQTNKNKDEFMKVIESSRLWIKNLYIFDAIFNWEKEKNNETIINLEYDIPQWFKNKNDSILNYKKKINYKMTYNKLNEDLKDELIQSFGHEDEVFTLGQYFHVRKTNEDEIMRSSIEVR